MRRLLVPLFAITALLLSCTQAPTPAAAQTTQIYNSCGTAAWSAGEQGRPYALDPTGNLCISGTISASASIAGFTPNGNYGTLIATAASSASTAMPSGAVVAFQNTSTIDVSCVFSAGVATATTNKTIVRGGSTIFITVGANTNAACINQTGSASNVVAMAAGTGLGTGFGGGGGASGGGGAITAASGSYASGAFSSGAFAGGALGVGSAIDGWDQTQGAKVDTACGTDNGTCSELALIKRTNQNLSTLNSTLGTPATAANQSTGNTSLGSIDTKVGTTNTNLGAQADAAAAADTSTASLIALLKRNNQNLTTLNTTAGSPSSLSSQYPNGAIPITASQTGTTAATTATLAGAVGKTTYICSLSIRSNATAAATGDATVTGTITGTLHYTHWTAPLASGIGLTEQIFSPCVPASTTNTAIAVISPAPGSGGVVSSTATGYQL